MQNWGVFFFFKYVLNDKISYPEETFMDWEFKISVMYDIAKVREKCSTLPVSRTIIKVKHLQASHAVCGMIRDHTSGDWLVTHRPERKNGHVYLP